ncbi:MAG TPA: DUF4340 domain-containing protein [Deltaproteobacteria bacterium]|nr:DUF4340 domain-containing protein [Deltaproteobacteria bacterium]
MVAANLAVNPRRTLLLALIAIAAGAWLYSVERPRMEAELHADELISFDVEAVAHISMDYPDGTTIVLERDEAADWSISAPLTVDADRITVERLIKAIRDTRVERRIAVSEAEDLSVYGLEDNGSQVRIKMRLDDGDQLDDIVVGDTTPVGYQAFVRIENSGEIVVTPLIFHTGVKKSVFDLREKRLFDFKPADVIAMTLETAEAGKIELQRAGDQWQLLEPVKGRADTRVVSNLLEALSTTRATAFYDQGHADSATTGLDEPSVSLTLRIGLDNLDGFKLGSAPADQPAGLYLSRLGDGQLAAVDRATKVAFARPLGELRDKGLFDCLPGEITSLSVERDDKRGFELTRTSAADDWTMSTEHGQRLLKEMRIDRAVGDLAELAGKSIVAEDSKNSTLGLYGLRPPSLRVAMARADGRSCGAALAGSVGEDDDKRYYLSSEAGNMVMAVPQYLYSRADLVADDFLSAPQVEEAPASKETPAAE